MTLNALLVCACVFAVHTHPTSGQCTSSECPPDATGDSVSWRLEQLSRQLVSLTQTVQGLQSKVEELSGSEAPNPQPTPSQNTTAGPACMPPTVLNTEGRIAYSHSPTRYTSRATCLAACAANKSCQAVNIDPNTGVAFCFFLGYKGTSIDDPGIQHSDIINRCPTGVNCDTTCEGLLCTGPTCRVACPALCNTNVGHVWGTDIYTAHSRLCKAAIHAGKLPPSGGSVEVHLAGGLSSFPGSSRNAVQSLSHPLFEDSCRFE